MWVPCLKLLRWERDFGDFENFSPGTKNLPRGCFHMKCFTCTDDIALVSFEFKVDKDQVIILSVVMA